mgnify:FL=1
MKHNAIKYLLALVMVLTSAMVIAAGNGPDKAYNPKPRPIIGSLSGEATFPENDECTDVTGAWWQTHTTAVGEMDHLGLTGHYGTHCSTLDGASLVGGEASFVAANGDEVWTTYHAQIIAPPPVMVFLTEYIVVGGTGRFEGASGTIMALVYVTYLGMDAPAFPVTMDFAGTIAY